MSLAVLQPVWGSQERGFACGLPWLTRVNGKPPTDSSFWHWGAPSLVAKIYKYFLLLAFLVSKPFNLVHVHR